MDVTPDIDGDDDMEDNDLEDGEISQHNDVIAIHHSSGTYSVPIHPASPPPTTQTSGTTRRKSGVMSDLKEGLKEVAAVKNEGKRLYDVGVEDTKRLEIREKYKFEQRRLDLEDKLMKQEKKIEMRKLALEERRLAMQMGEMEGGLYLFNPMAWRKYRR